MPSSVKATYKRVAVLEVDADMAHPPAMISLNARGVRAITRQWDACPANGKTQNSGIMQARRNAAMLAEILNTKLSDSYVQTLNTPKHAWEVCVAVVQRTLPVTPDGQVLWDALKNMDAI